MNLEKMRKQNSRTPRPEIVIEDFWRLFWFDGKAYYRVDELPKTVGFHDSWGNFVRYVKFSETINGPVTRSMVKDALGSMYLGEN